MKTWLGALAAAVGLAASHAACAADMIKTADSKIDGRVVATSPTEVTIGEGDAAQKIPVNQIEWVAFEEDPALLRRARDDAAKGQYEAAQRALENIKRDDIQRKEVLEDIEFYAALAAAKLALEGKAEIREAGKQLLAFLSAHPQSYHYLQASELVGDLYMALGQYAKAREYYERVRKASWPEYHLRATVAVGQILLAEQKPDEALKCFQEVLDSKIEGDQAARHRAAAVLGKARCLLETGKPDEAIRIAEAVIAKADPEDAESLGRAYLVLGIAQAKAGRTQDALYALLHVDTLYAANREVHAEALYHLVPLWKAVKKADRAQETQRILAEQYGDTRWGQSAEP